MFCRVSGPEDMLVGQLVPAEATDWNAEATVAQVTGEARGWGKGHGDFWGFSW